MGLPSAGGIDSRQSNSVAQPGSGISHGPVIFCHPWF